MSKANKGGCSHKGEFYFILLSVGRSDMRGGEKFENSTNEWKCPEEARIEHSRPLVHNTKYPKERQRWTRRVYHLRKQDEVQGNINPQPVLLVGGGLAVRSQLPEFSI
jgi:hypothetical protein